MNDSEIKAEIHRLRYVEKKTLTDIAGIFGKSIYWVNSRLNKTYEPKKSRRTASDIDTIINIDLNDSSLSNEQREVIRLRKKGLTYEEIASELNRSVYWVHSMFPGEYSPKGARAEKAFQEERVVPYLRKIGHTGIMQYVRTSSHGISQEADIVSSYNNRQVITEVKIRISHHQLQTAIGQLVIHKFTYDNSAQLQIALPEEAERRKLPKELIDFLKEIKICKILFIPKIYCILVSVCLTLQVAILIFV